MKVYRMSTKGVDDIEINEVTASIREIFNDDYDFDAFVIDCYIIDDEPYVYAKLDVANGYFIDDNKVYNGYGDYMDKETKQLPEAEKAMGIILNTFGFKKRKEGR